MSGMATGEWNWAYLIAGNQVEKLLVWSLVLRSVSFITRWIIPPVVIIGLANAEYLLAAKIIGAVWAIYVLYRVLTWPGRRRLRKARDQQRSKWTEVIEAMGRARAHTDSEIINPTRLKQLILEAENKGASLSPVIHSLLDRAIQRDAAVFIRAGKN